MTVGEETHSGRWEFRAWGELEHVRARLVAVAPCTGDECLHDRYLLGPVTSVNAKVRRGVLEVKHLGEVRDDIERWRPTWSSDAPFAPAVVADVVTELGSRRSPPAGVDEFAESDLSAFVDRDDDLVTAAVTKHRRRFRLGDVRAEATHLHLDGTDASVWTVAIEHVDPDAVVEARASLGLEGVANMSVSAALAAELGVAPDPARCAVPARPAAGDRPGVREVR